MCRRADSVTGGWVEPSLALARVGTGGCLGMAPPTELRDRPMQRKRAREHRAGAQRKKDQVGGKGTGASLQEWAPDDTAQHEITGQSSGYFMENLKHSGLGKDSLQRLV